MMWKLMAIGVAAAILVAGPAQGEIEYTVEDLGPLGYRHQTWSINQHGQVVGYSEELPNYDTEGFVFDGTDFILVGVPPQTSRSDLLGINDFGEATGKSGTVHESGQAILWTPGGAHGHIESLGTLGGSRSAGKSINGFRQVVGWTQLEGDLESRPFVWEEGVMTALPLLGGTQGSADWINDNGQIVGSSTTDTDDLQQFAVYWNGGDPVRLPPQYPGVNNIASYIHNNGTIAGSVRVPDDNGFYDRRAAVWLDPETYQVLGTLADGTPVEENASSWAQGVNAAGVVVGMSVNEMSQLVPFVYRRGEMVQLDRLIDGSWVMTYVGAGAINDAGQIAVSAFVPGDNSGNLHALLLTPTGTAAALDAPTRPGYALSAQARKIRYSIPHASDVSLRLFGANGQLVARLFEGAKNSGDYVTTWDGKTIQGVRASAGVYFAQLRTPEQSMSCRVLLLRSGTLDSSW